MISIMDKINETKMPFTVLAKAIGISDFTLHQIKKGKAIKSTTGDIICDYFKVKRNEVKEFQVCSNYKNKDTKEPEKINIKHCLHSKCPLNENKLCRSVIVANGIAGCASENKVS